MKTRIWPGMNISTIDEVQAFEVWFSELGGKGAKFVGERFVTEDYQVAEPGDLVVWVEGCFTVEPAGGFVRADSLVFDLMDSICRRIEELANDNIADPAGDLRSCFNRDTGEFRKRLIVEMIANGYNGNSPKSARYLADKSIKDEDQ